MDIDEVIEQKVENATDYDLMMLVADDLVEWHEAGWEKDRVLEQARIQYREHLIETIPEWVNESDIEEDGQ